MATRNTVIRKSLALGGQVRREVLRLASAFPDDALPAVLCNSFPKSGTHLLLQVLEALPTHNYGTFVGSRAAITYHRRHDEEVAAALRRLAPAELAPAHMSHSPLFEEVLRAEGIVAYCIIRDPRDVVVSEAHYIAEMNHFHPFHRRFAAEPTLEGRISLAINGAARRFGPSYPSIAERIREYVGWLSAPGVLVVRFEELVAQDRTTTIRQIVNHYLSSFDSPEHHREELTSRALIAINPARSHTFRKGTVGGWREAMTRRNKVDFERVAGELLPLLGYGDDTKI